VTRSTKSSPSKLATLKPANKAILPCGLPNNVERFYAKSDGLRITVG
jgi:hypothetical protein